MAKPLRDSALIEPADIADYDVLVGDTTTTSVDMGGAAEEELLLEDDANWAAWAV